MIIQHVYTKDKTTKIHPKVQILLIEHFTDFIREPNKEKLSFWGSIIDPLIEKVIINTDQDLRGQSEAIRQLGLICPLKNHDYTVDTLLPKVQKVIQADSAIQLGIAWSLIQATKLNNFVMPDWGTSGT